MSDRDRITEGSSGHIDDHIADRHLLLNHQEAITNLVRQMRILRRAIVLVMSLYTLLLLLHLLAR